MDFDAEVGAGFAECGMAGLWEDPESIREVAEGGEFPYISGSVTPLSV